MIRKLACVAGAWVLALVLLGPGAAPGALAGADLVSTISWSAEGSSGSVLFQGRLRGDVLEGRIYAGGEQVVVSGTVSPEGAVSGVLKAPEGVEIGRFSSVV